MHIYTSTHSYKCMLRMYMCMYVCMFSKPLKSRFYVPNTHKNITSVYVCMYVSTYTRYTRILPEFVF